MEIGEITDIQQLKAMAYDQMSNREQADRNLSVINRRIAELYIAQEQPGVSPLPPPVLPNP